jgi:uncharacterized membrane protein
MFRTTVRNGVLIYVNLRKKKFAIVADVGIYQVVGQDYWRRLGIELTEHLRSTQSEKAIALAVQSVGEVLRREYPVSVSDPKS